MNNEKKAVNVITIILASLLSALLVLLLAVTPVCISACNTFKPDTIAESLCELDAEEMIKMVGDLKKDDEYLEKLLPTNAVQEMYEAYITDMISIFDLNAEEQALTEEKLEDIIHENIDELYRVAVKHESELADLPKKEGKQKAEELLIETFSFMTKDLPSPETLRDELLDENPDLMIVLQLLAFTDIAKVVIIVLVVLLIALVFVCRLRDLRGLRWIAVDLFVASGIGILISGSLAIGLPLATSLIEGEPLVAVLIEQFANSFAVGVYLRTGIMLLSAAVLLAIDLLIKKIKAKKAMRAPVQPIVTPQQ